MPVPSGASRVDRTIASTCNETEASLLGYIRETRSTGASARACARGLARVIERLKAFRAVSDGLWNLAALKTREGDGENSRELSRTGCETAGVLHQKYVTNQVKHPNRAAGGTASVAGRV